MRTKQKLNNGYMLIQVIVFAAIAVYIISGLVGWAMVSVRAGRHAINRESAIQIAEAGTDYYRWHLAHAPTDYEDGTGAPGPYEHSFADKNGTDLGQFVLDITAPPLGSTLVTIASRGEVNVDSNIERTVTTRLAKPSFAKYAVVSNTDFSIGADIIGPAHSNGGIHFVSGTAYNLITSAVTTFSSAITNFVTEWGVYHASDPNPPTPFTPVTSVFMAGRQVGVPALDFTGITSDLVQLEAEAMAEGNYYASSTALGYHIVLQTNDTFDIYRVNTAATGGISCEARQWWTYPNCSAVSGAKWSIGTETLIGSDVPFPTNGIIFVEDHVWVNGTVDTARLTIVAASIPDVGTRRNIIVNNDLLYSHYDGQEVIGLIAQDNFWVGVVSDEDLRIDAAIIAQNGRVSRYAYRNCGTHSVKDRITFYGMFASNQRYAYGNLGSQCTNPPSGSVGFFASGYNDGMYNPARIYIYDPYLLYGPPPSFPLTSDQYLNLSWEE